MSRDITIKERVTIKVIKVKKVLKKGKNKILVWNGMGYSLNIVTTSEDTLSIEDLAYICIKSNKGLFIPYSKMDDENLEAFEDMGCLDSYAYCDMSEYGLENGFLLIENMRVEGVELY